MTLFPFFLDCSSNWILSNTGLFTLGSFTAATYTNLLPSMVYGRGCYGSVGISVFYLYLIGPVLLESSSSSFSLVFSYNTAPSTKCLLT